MIDTPQHESDTAQAGDTTHLIDDMDTSFSLDDSAEELRARLEQQSEMARRLVLSHDREVEELRKIEAITAANLAKQNNRALQLTARVTKLESELAQLKAVASGESPPDGSIPGAWDHPDVNALRKDNEKKALKIHAMGSSRRWQFGELFANARRNPRKMLSLPYDLIAFAFRR